MTFASCKKSTASPRPWTAGSRVALMGRFVPILVPMALEAALKELGDDEPLVVHRKAVAEIIAHWPEVIGRPIPMSVSA